MLPTRRDLVTVLLVLAGILGALALARWQGARDARSAVAIAALKDSVRVAHAQLLAERKTRDSLIAAARALDSARVAAERATDRATARARQAAAEARALLQAETIDPDTARATIATLADRIDSLIARHAAERQMSALQLGAYERTVTFVVQTTPTVDHLVAAQTRLIKAALARRPWWQRALGTVCTAGLTGTGGGGGAMVAGPAGAMVGAVAGLAVGHLACP